MINDLERTVIKCPEHLSVHDIDFRNKSINFLNNIANLGLPIKQPPNPILVDLTDLKVWNLSASVVLFAKITTVQLVSRVPDLVKVKLPRDKDVKKMIYDYGLWDAIKFGTDRKLEKNWSSGNSYQSGTNPEKHFEMTVNLIRDKYEDVPRALIDGINEAILNVYHHAYAPYPQGAVKRWWQFFHRTNDNRFRFFIYDTGIGIAQSFRNIQNLGGESDMIVHAMTRGVSSTKLPGRGNGSENIKKPVVKLHNCKLLVISGKGLYKLFEHDKRETANLDNSIGGTLLGWEFKLED